LRSDIEQAVGLDAVARLVTAAGCNCVLTPAGADVAFLAALGPPSPKEVVYAAGGYDVWDWGGPRELAQTGLSAEVAAQLIIDEYRAWKKSR
jgi:hypothetical protein